MDRSLPNCEPKIAISSSQAHYIITAEKGANSKCTGHPLQTANLNKTCARVPRSLAQDKVYTRFTHSLIPSFLHSFISSAVAEDPAGARHFLMFLAPKVQ